jgi:hypothetical protein
MGNAKNSFTQTVIDLEKTVNISLAAMQGMNDAMTTNEDSVVVPVTTMNPITGDPSIANFSIPSFHNILDQLNRVSNTVDSFVSGQGVVLLNDGTYRQVTTVPVAKSPSAITTLNAPTNFQVRNNWFFESLMFPQLYVQFDLKGLIDDRSDRVVVRRLIFDNFDSAETQWFQTNFIGKNYSYSTTINILSQNGKNYWLDEEVQELPLNPTKYTGAFRILNKSVINNKEWFYLDTLNYGLTSDSSVINNIQLKINDQLRYNDSLYSINSIEVTEKRVTLTALVGLGKPSINNYFYIYSTPFQEKLIQIPIGYDECDIIFLKGVNDDFNIIADNWGNGIPFYTNDLSLTGSTVSLESYYLNQVSDFGKQMEGQAKEKFVPAFFGVTPDAPTFQASQFTVSQVNTQLNAALDVDSIKSTQTQIESTKTIINSLKSTISQQKAELIALTDPAQRSDLQAKIDNNISQLSKKSVEYQSLVKSLATVAYENSAVLVNPKYRVRGFFDIPTGKTTTTDPNEIPQEIIQFDIAYRYLRLDNTGNPLNTYAFADPSSGQNITGTFTDWTIVQSPIKTKVFDNNTGLYVWKAENIADGETVNINQVDIPITKGEKVQIKIRSISEAGWPANPLKSSWSNTVVVTFPSNLEGSDQVVNILADSQSEETAIKLEETLNATGVISHLQDGIPNPNSGTGTFFKHQSVNISYDLPTIDINGNSTSVNVVDLQSTIDGLPLKTYVTLTKPAGATDSNSTKTITLQQLFQAIVAIDPSIYDYLPIA